MAPLLLRGREPSEPVMTLNFAFKAFDVLVAALIFTTLA